MSHNYHAPVRGATPILPLKTNRAAFFLPGMCPTSIHSEQTAGKVSCPFDDPRIWTTIKRQLIYFVREIHGGNITLIRFCRFS